MNGDFGEQVLCRAKCDSCCCKTHSGFSGALDDGVVDADVDTRLRIGCIVNRHPTILQVHHPTSDSHLSQIAFDSLILPATLKRGIAELGYTRCTPIQAETLFEALAGETAGQAQTGTGKTAAYLVALFNRLLTEPPSPKRPVNAPRAIVIAPTRELAVQIHSDALGIGSYTGLKLAIVFGGVDYEKQRVRKASMC